MIPNRSSKVCVVCGKDAYHLCMKCKGPDGKKGVAMHLNKSDERSLPCALLHHNTQFYGLSKNDHRLRGIKRKKDWTFPTAAQQKEHSVLVNKLTAPEAQANINAASSVAASAASSRVNATAVATATVNATAVATATLPPINYHNVI